MITLLLTLSQTALAHPNHTQDWENWDSIAICQTDHEQCHTISEARPKMTRNPSIQRFSDPSLKDAKWTTLHILRLQNPNEPLETRLALLDMVMRSEGDWENGVLFLAEDSAPEMRVLLVESTKFGSDDFAHKIFLTLVADQNDSVREAVYRSISHKDASKYEAVLLSGLQDINESAQLAAIKSIGWSRLECDTAHLSVFLVHENPELRLHALRAIFRINSEAAKSLPQLKALQKDSNTKVAREAQRIAQ